MRVMTKTELSPEVTTENLHLAETLPIRVLIVDDHQIVREGLRRMLDMDKEIQVIGEAVDGEDAISKSMSLSPHVITMDLKMPGMDGIAATTEIKKRNPGISILMFTLYAGDLVQQAIESGASGYLLKTSDGAQITKAIHQVHGGLCPITPSLTW